VVLPLIIVATSVHLVANHRMNPVPALTETF